VGWSGERVLTDVRGDLFAHLQRLSVGYYEKNRAGVLISRLTNDVEALQHLVTDGITTTLQNVLSLGGTAIILLLLDCRLGLATMSVFPIMAVATLLYRRVSIRAYRAMRTELANVTAGLQEDLTGVRVIQAFAREDRSRDEFEAVNARYRDANQ